MRRKLDSRRDVDGHLHLRMDAAEHQIRTFLRERDLDRLARLLRAGIEIEFLVEHADVVRALFVVEEPELLAAPDRHMRRREALVVLRDGRRANDPSAESRLSLKSVSPSARFAAENGLEAGNGTAAGRLNLAFSAARSGADAACERAATVPARPRSLGLRRLGPCPRAIRLTSTCRRRARCARRRSAPR